VRLEAPGPLVEADAPARALAPATLVDVAHAEHAPELGLKRRSPVRLLRRSLGPPRPARLRPDLAVGSRDRLDVDRHDSLWSHALAPPFRRPTYARTQPGRGTRVPARRAPRPSRRHHAARGLATSMRRRDRGGHGFVTPPARSTATTAKPKRGKDFS